MQASHFLPSRDGFPFRNDFEYPPSRVGRGAPIAQGYGLAGGMCLAALDRWLTGRPLPSPDAAPQPGQPLYEELTRRQVELLGQGTWSRILDWQSRPGVRRRLGPAGLAELTRREWVRLRRSLDAGLPAIVCILRTRGPFANPSENPLLLAYRYEYARETRRATVWLYDPNRPGNDDVRMTVAVGSRRRPPETTYIAERVRGFLALPYDRPARNSTLRAVELADGSAGGLAGTAAPLHGRGLGAAVRGRDGSLLLIDGSPKKGKTGPRVQRLAVETPIVSDPVAIGGRAATILARDTNGTVVVFRRGIGGWRGRPVPGLEERLQIEFGPVGIAARGKLHAFGVRKGKLVHMVRHWTGRWTAGEVVAQAGPDGREPLEGTPAVCQSANRGLHVFVRTAKGRIAHMRLTTENKWSASLLPAADNAVASDPVVAAAPGDDQITLFAVTEEGELIQTRGSGSDTWRVRNLTRETAVDGGPHPMRVEIAVSAGPANTLHVFGVSPRNGLVHYWCPPTLAWRAQDLTHGRPDIGDGARVRGRPSVTLAPDDQLVVACAGEKGIVVYRWSAASDWTGDVLPAPPALAQASVPVGPAIWPDSAGEIHLLAVLEDGRAILGLPGRPDSAHRRISIATDAGRRKGQQAPPARAAAAAAGVVPGEEATANPELPAAAPTIGRADAREAEAAAGMSDESTVEREVPPMADVDSFESFDMIGSYDSIGATEGAGPVDLSFGSLGGMELTSAGADEVAEEPATLLDISLEASTGSDDAGVGSDALGLIGSDLTPMDAQLENQPVTQGRPDARDDETSLPRDADRDGWGSYAAASETPATPEEEAAGASLDLGPMSFEPAPPLLPDSEASRPEDLGLPLGASIGHRGEASAADPKAAEKAAKATEKAARATEKEAARIATEKKEAEEKAARVAAKKAAVEKAERIAAKKKVAEEEAARVAAVKKAAEKEAARIAAEKKAAEKEAARIAAEKKAREAARIAAEKKAAEDEALRIAAEEAAAEKAAAQKAAVEKAAAEKAAAEKAEAERARKSGKPAQQGRPIPALDGLPLLDEDTRSPAPRAEAKEETSDKDRPPPKASPSPKPKLRSVDDLIRLSDEHDPKFEKK